MRGKDGRGLPHRMPRGHEGPCRPRLSRGGFLEEAAEPHVSMRTGQVMMQEKEKRVLSNRNSDCPKTVPQSARLVYWRTENDLGAEGPRTWGALSLTQATAHTPAAAGL